MAFQSYDPLRVKQSLMRGSCDIVSSDERGQVVESGFTISDTATTDLSHVLRTAEALEAGLETKMNLVDPSVSGDLASLDSSGQVQDSNLKVDDSSAPSATVLYSSLKSKNYFVKGTFDIATFPNLTYGQVMNGTASADLDGAWSGSVYTAPVDGVYSAMACLKLTNGQTVADGWLQLGITGPADTCGNRLIFGTAYPGVVNDSVWIQSVGIFDLTAGQQISFRIWQACGNAKTIVDVASFFSIVKV